MYQEFYKLSKEPFRLTPDPAICFRHKSFKKAKSYLQYAIHRREGLVLVTGGPGSGKTSIIADFLLEPKQDIVVANIVVNEVEAKSILPLIANGFGLTVDIVTSESQALLLKNLDSYLREVHGRGSQPLLILDEAQNISLHALEELRLLNTIQVGEYPLIQFFLVGQNALREKILLPELEQLRQRFLATCCIEYLERYETADYIEAHLNQAGWMSNTQILSRPVMRLIHQFSLGIPRWINQICSRLLLHGMIEKKLQLYTSDLNLVLQDLVNEDLLPKDVRNNAEALISKATEVQQLGSALKARHSG